MKEWHGVLIYFLMAVLFAFFIYLIICNPGAFAEEEYANCTEAWILCSPDGWVNSRVSPKKNGEINAYLFPGQRIYLDGKEKRGYVHYVGTNSEDGQGWVYKAFIVLDKPVEDGHVYPIKSSGRVTCRRYINGPRRCWVNDYDPVTVYMRSEEWCVTDKGFIRTQFIDLCNRQDIENHSSPDDLTWEDD